MFLFGFSGIDSGQKNYGGGFPILQLVVTWFFVGCRDLVWILEEEVVVSKVEVLLCCYNKKGGGGCVHRF